MNTTIAALALGLATLPGAALAQPQPAAHHCAAPAQPTKARIQACAAAVAAKGVKPDERASDYFDLASSYEAWGDRRREVDALDKAIGLKADFWEARIKRAQLYLMTGLFERATPDYLALHKAFPGPAPIVGLPGSKNGGLQNEHDRIAFMIPSLQRELLMRSTRRCRARVLAGLELDGARKDCETAVQLDPGNKSLPVHESLGILDLRQEDWPHALAEFETVFKQDPRAVSSLYLKGVVERRMGNSAKGDADIAAAEKVNPRLAQQAHSAGLDP